MFNLTADKLVQGRIYVMSVPYIPDRIKFDGANDGFRANRLINHPLKLINRQTMKYAGTLIPRRECIIQGLVDPFVVQANGDLPELECRTLGDCPVNFLLPRDNHHPVLEVSKKELEMYPGIFGL
jgi:hypothetical protein